MVVPLCNNLKGLLKPMEARKYIIAVGFMLDLGSSLASGVTWFPGLGGFYFFLKKSGALEKLKFPGAMASETLS